MSTAVVLATEWFILFIEDLWYSKLQLHSGVFADFYQLQTVGIKLLYNPSEDNTMDLQLVLNIRPFLQTKCDREQRLFSSVC